MPKGNDLPAIVQCVGGPLDGQLLQFTGNAGFTYATDGNYTHDGKHVHHYTLTGGPLRFVHKGRNLSCHCAKCRELHPNGYQGGMPV